MKSVTTPEATRPKHDPELLEIARYVTDQRIESSEAYATARLALMDSLGCGFRALAFPECTRHLGPIVPGTRVPLGTRVPGTSHELDPLKAAWDTGCLIRWLDFNDTWLAAEWGHPSDNLGAILAAADYLGRRLGAEGPTVHDVLTAMIKAYEIQGVLALENSFNRVGLDHVLLVRVASAAVAAGMLGASTEQIADVVSHAWLDGSALRTYRHAPNAGPRKSWAAGDATSRGLMLAMIVMRGEIGYPSALSAERWGFYDVSFDGKPFRMQRPYGSYVMENILFKVSYPAEFHAQTAVEAAIVLHPEVAPRLQDIERIVIRTHESAIRIISKTGPLDNPADRDHCLQYMVGVALANGDLRAEDYEDDVAADPRIDALRELMHVEEDPRYSADYLDPSKRSIANRIFVEFKDGSRTPEVEIEYPLGHRRRRAESLPALRSKFEDSLSPVFESEQAERIQDWIQDPEQLDRMPASELLDRLDPGPA